MYYNVGVAERIESALALKALFERAHELSEGRKKAEKGDQVKITPEKRV